MYSLSTYSTPCFLSNLVSFYVPFGPPSFESSLYESDSYDDEISMDRADSHVELPSNQQ